MEPTESAAPDSRLRLRRRAVAWRGYRWTGRAEGRTGVQQPRPAGPGTATEAHPPLSALEPAPGLAGADSERHPSWPALPAAPRRRRGLRPGRRLLPRLHRPPRPLPCGTVGWALALLTGVIVGHLVMLGRARWWGGTGSGAALTLAVLLLYGWVPAGLVSLTVVVLVGIARRHRWRQGVLHGAVDILGIGAGALLLGVFGRVPSVEEPWRPDTWTIATAPQVVLVAVAYLAVSRGLLWYLHAPRGGGVPTVARTALVRQGAGRRRPARHRAPAVRRRRRPARPAPAVRDPADRPGLTLWMARARAEEQLRDPLTGLPNRQWLLERIWTALDDAERIGARAALMLIDLDRFRSVNDTLGHLAGDRLLLQIADRLRLALPRGAEAARLGGDEFAVLLPVADSTTSATRVARGLVAALSSPLDLDGLTLVLEASAGVAVFPDHALDAEGLLRRADVAMYQAEGPYGRRGLRVQAGLQHARPPRPAGRPAPGAGRARGAAALPAQGPLRRTGGRPEAPVRWVHPERGKVPPDEFIAIAESSGLMPHLTEYVLETALAQVARWRAQGLRVPVAVNVSRATSTPRDSPDRSPRAPPGTESPPERSSWR